jgi:hypothetical protein
MRFKMVISEDKREQRRYDKDKRHVWVHKDTMKRLAQEKINMGARNQDVLINMLLDKNKELNDDIKRLTIRLDRERKK